MAVIKKGILGGFKGKAGTVVGYELNGQDIMRGIGEERNKPYTPKELANQRKFGSSQSWLQPIISVLRIGFAGYSPNTHGFNGAKSYTNKFAVKGLDPYQYVDPALACISHGKLYAGTGLKAEITEDLKVLFTWDKEGPGAYNDRAIVVAYDIEGGEACYETETSVRTRGKAILDLEGNFAGKEIHVYMGFVSEDRKGRSISKYLGKFLIPGIPLN